MKKPKLFISHAWDYNKQYHSLLNLLEQRKYFDFQNHSVPEHDPLDFKTIGELRTKLTNQIKASDIVIVIAGMYPSFRRWIQEEINIAVDLNKPIIGIYPRGQINASKIVTENADSLVNWNTESVVAEIRKFI